ncbi:MAG TPA: maleylacetoacetate isomerase [Pseudobdellovibrionaceae bacterium]
MVEFILHNYFRSSTSYRTRIVLNYKNLPFEYKAVHLLKGEQLSPEYKKLNPIGGVPTLVHNGKVIPDSYAIIEYLEEIVPTPALLPKDIYLRARVRQVCEIINSSMHPLGNLRVLKYLEQKNGYNQNQKDEWAQHWGSLGLEALETNLQEFAGTYCFGDSVTMADVFLVPQIVTCQRFKIDTEKYKLLTRIFNHCQKLEAFTKAHPFRQPDTPEENRIK